VGESLQVRREGDAVAHCTAQLRTALSGVTAAQAKALVVAYEPIWAIGTGKTATADDAQATIALIRGAVVEAANAEAGAAVRIQYGGSVKPGNIAELMAQPDIDGALVGGASLEPDSFAAICGAARQ
jgi:triosephosphate isomerase